MPRTSTPSRANRATRARARNAAKASGNRMTRSRTSSSRRRQANLNKTVNQAISNASKPRDNPRNRRTTRRRVTNAVAAMASNVSNRLATGARFAHRHPMTAAVTGLGAAIIASKARNSMYPPVQHNLVKIGPGGPTSLGWAAVETNNGGLVPRGNTYNTGNTRNTKDPYGLKARQIGITKELKKQAAKNAIRKSNATKRRSTAAAISNRTKKGGGKHTGCMCTNK